jgi:hypothetical protein
MTRKTITTVVAAIEKADQLRQDAPTDDRDRELAQMVLDASTRDVIEALARHELIECIRHARRTETLAAERRAAERAAFEAARRRAAQSPDPHDGMGDKTRQQRMGYRRRNSPKYWKWVEETEEGRAFEAREQEWDEHEADAFEKHLQALRDLTDAWVRDLRMEWTEELLSSAFALPDGTLTTWGAATVADHEARRDMFTANAQANVEGAARHDAAIRELQDAGVSTLNELVTADRSAA